MKRFMRIAEYSEESGLPVELLRKLTRCRIADQFSFRSSSAVNAPIYINVPIFEKMMDSGELKEVLEV